MTYKNKANDVVKHSAAHVLALAVKRLYPDVKVGIGPVTKEGFYYDFYFGSEIPNVSLEDIENVANEVIGEDLAFKQIILSKEEAYNMLLQIGQIFKAELIQAIPDPEVSFYKLGNEFIDLCRGPHVNTTNTIGLIKLDRKEIVFWKDDPKRGNMLRIYGMVFNNENEFNDYQLLKKSLTERDFFKLASSLDLIVQKEKQPILYTEDGAIVIEELKDHFYKHMGHIEMTPIVAGGNVVPTQLSKLVDENFKRHAKSYKQLPIVYTANTWLIHKINEKDISGEILYYKSYSPKPSTLTFITDTIDNLIKAVRDIAGENINIEIFCANLEDEYVQSISNFLQKNLISHNKVLSDRTPGIFRLIFNINDSVGKLWRVAEFYLYEDPEIQFTNSANKKENALIFEFFIYVLNAFGYFVEEYKNSMPFDFVPIQIMCIPTSNAKVEFGKEVIKALKSFGFRAKLDETSKSFKYKIRRAEDKKIPYIFIIGNKEDLNKAVSVRHNGNEIGLVSIQNIKAFVEENNNKM